MTVDITDVPPEVKGIKLMSGSSMKPTTIVERDGRRYAEAKLSKARVGFRQITLRGEDAVRPALLQLVEPGDGGLIAASEHANGPPSGDPCRHACEGRPSARCAP